MWSRCLLATFTWQHHDFTYPELSHCHPIHIAAGREGRFEGDIFAQNKAWRTSLLYCLTNGTEPVHGLTVHNCMLPSEKKKSMLAWREYLKGRARYLAQRLFGPFEGCLAILERISLSNTKRSPIVGSTPSRTSFLSSRALHRSDSCSGDAYLYLCGTYPTGGFHLRWRSDLPDAHLCASPSAGRARRELTANVAPRDMASGRVNSSSGIGVLGYSPSMSTSA